MADNPSVASRRTSILGNFLLAGLIGLLTLIVLSQANPGLTLLNRDEGVYEYIGQQILLGKLPYKDAWESKPPAIFYVDALGLWAAHGLRWGIWAIEFICLAVAIWLSYILMKKLWGGFPAVCAIAIWIFGLNLTLQGGNITEEFPLLVHFLALIIFLRLAESPDNFWDGLIIGLAFSISFLFRANNAMVETAIVLALLLIWMIQRNFRAILRQLLWMGIGALIPILITSIYFWSLGIFKAMFDASITYNFTYSGTKVKQYACHCSWHPKSWACRMVRVGRLWDCIVSVNWSVARQNKTFSDPSLFTYWLSVCGGGHRSSAKNLWTLFC